MSTRFFVLFVPILLLILSGCVVAPEQELEFEVIVDGVPFPVEDIDMDTMPVFLVIADSTEGTQPAAGLDFPKPARVVLRGLDYDQAFAILILRGQILDSGTVKQVVRDRNKVIIRTHAIDPGPGNYVLPGLTPLYQIISVKKTGLWNERFHVMVEREGMGVIDEGYIYIP